MKIRYVSTPHTRAKAQEANILNIGLDFNPTRLHYTGASDRIKWETQNEKEITDRSRLPIASTPLRAVIVVGGLEEVTAST
uniref:Uncharacterized protein n=1 Tax=Pristionchus pacificus TaxID=54126 RepID=A0A2A6CTF9_PRIPA|eukprot:PDM81398.1 hypothetical protein PRIPAC_35274 [Pristionchus pacificus]